jgi:hypothetical protein
MEFQIQIQPSVTVAKFKFQTSLRLDEQKQNDQHMEHNHISTIYISIEEASKQLCIKMKKNMKTCKNNENKYSFFRFFVLNNFNKKQNTKINRTQITSSLCLHFKCDIWKYLNNVKKNKNRMNKIYSSLKRKYEQDYAHERRNEKKIFIQENEFKMIQFFYLQMLFQLVYLRFF